MTTLHSLFPKARAELLRLLLTDPAKELHLRDLAKQSGMSVGALQKEVQRLEETELLVSRRDGNRLYFRANDSHPIFPELRGIVEKTSGLANSLSEATKEIDGINLAFVFGSTASGQAKASSDVDFFAIGSVGLRKLTPKLRPVSESIGREINPYTITAKGFAQKAASGDAFIQSILNAPKLWIKGSDDELAAMV
ncbi:nucleotidyltransferase domain-containing protein [Pelagicoccus sp. SDUM812002]|uniref:nucleotidyltransferase domain-containing protein n=1 Tax=Pelagicoccus sp. SDUM812002 TaxID=3041266 RepID=UPI0028107B43|nr:nucleotidyltransferase domain-containing protein [Pelagicoccus sp. SDUM812002]MDQ8188481.1 nucleotidyltransferase domain-containing protein [Pelagicoccus sp. SDUM812002]